MDQIYATIDIGSATIKLVVAKTIGSSIYVLFSKVVPSHGVKVGIIENSKILVQDITSLIGEANEKLGTIIQSVALNIPSIHARLYQSEGSVELVKMDQKINQDDIVKCLREAGKFGKHKNEEVISVVPVRYHYDGIYSDLPPVNKIAKKLSVEALVITSDKKIVYPYVLAIEKVGLEVLDIGLNAYSCAKETFDRVYLKEGAILIDMGYKTTTISFYQDGFLKYLTTARVGGYDFTKRIAQELQIPMSQAEVYKIKYGSLDDSFGEVDIIHTTENGDYRRDFTQKEFSYILYDSAQEIMQVIKEKLDVIENIEKKEIVLVGGGSSLAMIEVVASEVFESPVRIYRPDTIGARDTSFVSSLGLLYHILDKGKIGGAYPSSLKMLDVSSTMSHRLKGLTKVTSKTTGTKFGRLVDSLFSDE